MALGQKLDSEKVIRLWNNGLLDKEIAELLGCSKKSISNYRQHHGMPSNFGIFKWDKEGVGKQ